MYLQSNNGTSFRGFMIQARTVADESPAGYFVNNGTEYQLQCDNDVSACTIVLIHSCINYI